MTVSGAYPRTTFTVTGPDAHEPDAYRLAGWDDVWDDDQDPSNYPLEQEAASVALTLERITRGQPLRPLS